MTIRELRWLLELSRELNVTRAAEHLFITQPSLSQCLQRAEAELGFPLFQRSRRKITVTPQGTRFLATAQEMLRAYDACLQEIYAEDTSPFSQVTIGVTPYINTYAAAGVATLREKFPQISIRILESNSEDLVQKFREGAIQVLSTNMDVRDPEYHRTDLGSFRMYILLRRGSPAAAYAQDRGGAYPELDPIHLAGEPLAISAPGSRSRQMALEIYRQAGITPTFVQAVTRPTALTTLAESGVASSIYALSREVRNALSLRELVYAIPDHYPSAVSRRLLLCRRSSLPRFPQGFYPELEEIFHACMAASE